MSAKETSLEQFKAWYGSLQTYKQNNGPAKGTIAGALVVLENLKSEFSLEIDKHTTPGGTQIKGASRIAVKRILNRHGEIREFVKEGGRTNRGLRGDIKRMLQALSKTPLSSLEDSNKRAEILDELQSFLVERVRDFHNRQRLEPVYDPAHSVWTTIHNLLKLAREEGKEGPVAQYLVGAKLQLRFKDIVIGNESYSTADTQLSRPGDFVINNTAFHVTVAPQSNLYVRCQQNLNDGVRPYLIVPNRVLEGTRQNAELAAPGKITVASIESFVSQNIEELACFSNRELVKGLRALLEMYNNRVEQVEVDKSMLIKIPPNLEKH